jgi:hypothetical protein
MMYPTNFHEREKLKKIDPAKTLLYLKFFFRLKTVSCLSVPFFEVQQAPHNIYIGGGGGNAIGINFISSYYFFYNSNTSVLLVHECF